MRPGHRIFVWGLYVGIACSMASGDSFAGRCKDSDGDGHGVNCAQGPDCDDNDPTVYFNAPEICDGKDNDCTPASEDGVEESGDPCDTGDVGACGEGLTQCVDAVLECVGTPPGPELCNGIDDDCNGIVDDGPGDDQDGDGITTFCDCDDTDPATHPGARDLCGDGVDQDCDGSPDNLLLDGDGKSYCLDVDPILASEGQPAFATIRAYHEAGVHTLELMEEFDPPGTQVLPCGSTPTCTLDALVGDFDAPRFLTVTLKKETGSGVFQAAQVGKVVDFVCQREHCRPDPRIGDFMVWMRDKGYAECVASKYLEWSIDLSGIEDLWDRIIQTWSLGLRGNPAISQPLVVDFYDIVPTDPGSTFVVLEEGKGGKCKKSTGWATFCPKPETADYLFLERHLERSYGLELSLVYHRLDLDYVDTFGPPTPSGNKYRFNIPPVFYQDFGIPFRSILHFAMETFQGSPIQDFGHAGGGSANTTFEPGTAGPEGAGSYTHEWGHSWGMLHPFVNPGGFVPFPTEFFFTLDGVMDNSYRLDTTLTDPTDPLERYAMEPQQGDAYVDDATFAADYSAAITGTSQLPGCGDVDPAIESGSYLGTTGGDHVFEVTLTNHGVVPVGYVTIHATDSSVPGVFYADRVVHALAPGASQTHQVSVPLQDLLSSGVEFELDPGDEIVESSESNNVLTVSLPDCVDADGDGYPQSCVACAHSACPILDCHDANPGVNPGAVEGPPGDPTCQDGLDNNCNSLIDGWDEEACSFVRKVTADHSTGPGSRIQGYYLHTWNSDDAWEVLQEGLISGLSRLEHTWRFENVPNGSAYELLLEGHRPVNPEGDNFQLSVSVDGSSFTDIPGAILQRAMELTGGEIHPLDPGPHSGTIYLRVRDTDATMGAGDLDTVLVDYLAIRVIP